MTSAAYIVKCPSTSVLQSHQCMYLTQMCGVVCTSIVCACARVYVRVSCVCCVCDKGLSYSETNSNYEIDLIL